MRWRGSSRPTTSGASSPLSKTHSFSSAKTTRVRRLHEGGRRRPPQLREPDAEVRHVRRRRPRLVRDSPRQGLRLSRPERLGEIHDDPDADGTPRALRGEREDAAGGPGARRRARHRRLEDASRVHEPEVLPLSRPDGRGEPDVLRIDLRPSERAPLPAGSRSCPNGCASRSSCRRSRKGFRRVIASASRSRPRFSTSRSSCSWTSRPAGSIREDGGSSGISSTSSRRTRG